MYITAKLVFQSYIPDEITTDTLFKRHVKENVLRKTFEYDQVYTLTDVRNREQILIEHGYPVQPVIVSITANPDDKAAILATPAQIGWWDDGPAYDDLRDIDIKDMNGILEIYDGEIDIEVDDNEYDNDIIKPILYQDKVCLGLTGEWYTQLEELDEDTPPDDREEEWDDMDDWTHDEPLNYDPNDRETE